MIEKLLGHRLPGIGDLYTHDWDSRLREAVIGLAVEVTPSYLELIQNRVSGGKWCRGTESNCRHQPFQGCALPTELPRHKKQERHFYRMIDENQARGDDVERP